MGQTSTRTESIAGSEGADAALRFARRVHLGQHRKQTGGQFVEHPIAVAALLAAEGCSDDVLIAAYLHDAVEKTPVTSDEIRLRFGDEAAAVVDALTEDASLEEYAERKRALRSQVLAAGEVPVLIYAADRLANMRDWLSLPPEQREPCAGRLETTLPERLQLWAEDLDELTRFDPELVFLAGIQVGLAELRRGSGGVAPGA
ncbi:MAG: metal dependent phosphohydrolase [Solirubrobacterales bacterium]|jgi:(p)ppGpp synthase/HD superfamily hydrolase|nr:metal dependent phosphohydrolase [Solirubrobacterales bacterium]